MTVPAQPSDEAGERAFEKWLEVWASVDEPSENPEKDAFLAGFAEGRSIGQEEEHDHWVPRLAAREAEIKGLKLDVQETQDRLCAWSCSMPDESSPFYGLPTSHHADCGVGDARRDAARLQRERGGEQPEGKETA